MDNQNQLQTSFNQRPALISVGDLFKKTWYEYKGRLSVFILITLVPFAVSFLLLAASEAEDFINSVLGWMLLVVFYVLVIFVNLLSQAALIFAVKEKEIGAKEAFQKSWHKIISFAWVSSLSFLIVIGGFILFIVPGIIFSVWYSLAAYALIVDGKKGMDALSQSKQLVKGSWWSVFWRFLVISVIVGIISIIVSFIPFGAKIFTLFSVPFTVTFTFLLYKELKQLKT